MSNGLSDGCLEERISYFEVGVDGADINKSVSILLNELIEKQVSRTKRPAARLTRLLSVPVYGNTANDKKKSFKGNEVPPDMFLGKPERFPLLQHRHYLGADIKRVQQFAKDRAFEEIKTVTYPIDVFILVPNNQRQRQVGQIKEESVADHDYATELFPSINPRSNKWR
jgi:hypothetical protein